MFVENKFENQRAYMHYLLALEIGKYMMGLDYKYEFIKKKSKKTKKQKS